MRLTKKTKYGYTYIDVEIDSEKEIVTKRKVQTPVGTKLGQLEDIEDKLGIDLITFFNFLNSKVCYEKDLDDNEITKCLITGITKTGVLNVPEELPYKECEREAKFKDHGITWALTRKELLKHE